MIRFLLWRFLELIISLKLHGLKAKICINKFSFLEWPLDSITIREFIDDYLNMPIESLM